MPTVGPASPLGPQGPQHPDRPFQERPPPSPLRPFHTELLHVGSPGGGSPDTRSPGPTPAVWEHALRSLSRRGSLGSGAPALWAGRASRVPPGAESEPCSQRAGVSPRCLACGPESCSRPCVRTVGGFVSTLGILLCHSQASHPHRVPACHSPRDRLREDATPPRPALPGGSRSDHAPAQSCLTLDPTDHSPPAARQLLCPRHSPGRNTAVGCHTLLQRLFLTQGPNARLPHCRRILHQ